MISIIIPVYNVAHYIRKCLDSVISQTFKDFECVLVDDGSIDESGDICDEYAAADSRFLVIHKKNEGVALARLTGFEHSKGEYITFVDADDYVSPEYLEKLVKPIHEKDADMVSCDYLTVENNETIREPRAKLNGEFEKEQIKDFIEKHYFYDKETKGYGMTCYLWSKMVKRQSVGSGLKKCLGMWYGEDQIAMLNMLMECEKICLISDRLYYYVKHKGQTSQNYDFSLWNNVIALLKNAEQLCKQNGISPKEGLRKRTWLFIKDNINRMIKGSVRRAEYIQHLKIMREDEYIQRFFRPYKIDDGLNGRIKYILLKLRLFHLFYLSVHYRYFLRRSK